MKRYLRAALDSAQQLAARSRTLVVVAVLVRNQCRCVIKYRLAESPDVAGTGEVWLRDELAPHVRRIVDVGANIGGWLAPLLSMKAGSRYSAIAFEPSESALERLRERFAGDPNVEIVGAAVGDRSGEATFYEEGDAGKGSSIVEQFGAPGRMQRRVPVVTLDEQVTARGWDGIDLLKIDAEGYDMRVMHGANALLSGGRIGVVQFEYNRGWQIAGNTLFAAMRLLESYGYTVYVLKRDGLYTLNYALYEEFFEYANFVALSPRYAALLSNRARGTI